VQKKLKTPTTGSELKEKKESRFARPKTNKRKKKETKKTVIPRGKGVREPAPRLLHQERKKRKPAKHGGPPNWRAWPRSVRNNHQTPS